MSRYTLHEEIGRGAMGVVYRATQLDLDRVVALKLLALDVMDDRSAVSRFHAEAQALASLDHPHIVRVLDTGTLDGRPFMAMELLEGADLQTVRDRGGPQTVERVLSWLLQLTDALATIHARGFVHRDVKPTNVFVSPSGHATLMDFGLVRAENAQRLTEPGTVVGTPRYLAPEAVVGDPPAPPLDVFALARPGRGPAGVRGAAPARRSLRLAGPPAREAARYQGRRGAAPDGVEVPGRGAHRRHEAAHVDN